MPRISSLPTLILAALVVAAIAFGFWPRPVFAIRVARGVPRVRRGKVSAEFLDAVADLCRRRGIASGTIRGVAEGQRTSLKFTGGFSPDVRQQIRNLWNLPRGKG